MTTRFRHLVASALAGATLALLPAPARGQTLATFGAIEAAGLGEGLALFGVGLSHNGLGWGPTAAASLLSYRYRTGVRNNTAQAYAFAPGVGLQNNYGTGAFQALVGYTFVNVDAAPPSGIIGLEAGSQNSPFVLGQVNHWGDGNVALQAIASYNFQAQYTWARARGAQRLAGSPVFVGAEVVAQGTPKNSGAFRFNVGPTIEYRVTEQFRLGASGGLRTGTNNLPTTGYVRAEFLALTNF